MKRILMLTLICTLFLAGCAQQPRSPEILKFAIDHADDLTIGYVVSSYAMVGADQVSIDQLVEELNALAFDETDSQLDAEHALIVTLSDKGEQVASFMVDEQGIFLINGSGKRYEVSSGDFSYARLKRQYDQSRPTGLEPQRQRLLDLVNGIIQYDPDHPDLLLSSNPYDYIEAHQALYDQLVSGGQSTAVILIDILRESNEFGLDKYIMAQALADITGIDSGLDKTWASADEWLELYEHEMAGG